MQAVQPQKSPRGKTKKRRAHSYPATYFQRFDDTDDMMDPDAVEEQDVQANSTCSSQRIIYSTLLFVKVGLWVLFAWILSCLHMGAPCFLLPLILWLYSVPMHRALHWAKRRLWARAA